MARVMICDDDKAMADEMIAALSAAKHEATTCHHTMDVLREATEGCFDLIIFGLDMPSALCSVETRRIELFPLAV